jgi:DNA mismatch repair ATPase MutS
MKVFLLHRDQDFAVAPELRDAMFDAMMSGDPYAISNIKRDWQRNLGHTPVPELPDSTTALIQDLELETLWTAMAAGDEFLHEMAKTTVLSSLTDPDAIVYRQQVLADCLAHPDTVRLIYTLAVEALAAERKSGGLWWHARPDSILSRSVQALKIQVEALKRLRQIADAQASRFRSAGFTRLFAMLADELNDDYLQTVGYHLHELEFKRGLLESAQLAKGLKGRRYIVRTTRIPRRRRRLPFASRSDSYGFTIPPRDENGFRALEEIRGRGINQVANTAAQSADHVRSFLSTLRLELGFYLGCLNLHTALVAKREPVCFPEPRSADHTTFTALGIYDVCLTLHLDNRVVGNDINAAGKSLIMITGANQGGKSTLLRGIGLAQLMMQAGMFVGARSLNAGVCNGLFTHYKREEDVTMRSGKLDEELGRMSEIVNHISRHSMLLCNESFASTNEREGSEIARQIVSAMLRKQIKVVFVTHMYDLAQSLHTQHLGNALFLRAEPRPDGRRTFELAERGPLPTSYGQDSYQRIFGSPPRAPVT